MICSANDVKCPGEFCVLGSGPEGRLDAALELLLGYSGHIVGASSELG